MSSGRTAGRVVPQASAEVTSAAARILLPQVARTFMPRVVARRRPRAQRLRRPVRAQCLRWRARSTQSLRGLPCCAMWRRQYETCTSLGMEEVWMSILLVGHSSPALLQVAADPFEAVLAAP